MATLYGQLNAVNKEPEWSNLCNNVFEQYLDDDDVFGFERDVRKRSSSDDSAHIFDSSAGSEQSHQTAGTSPIPAWAYDERFRHPRDVDTQPRPLAAPGNWNTTVRMLEKNAADTERRQQKLRSTKSHPDFLSLGGFPSPPAIPASPTDQSLSVRRQRSRVFGGDAANGRKQNQARSVSRGRPSGVVKALTAAGTPNAPGRKTSASPRKMMNPSRFRAGFKDIWAERIAKTAGKKTDLSIPANDMFLASPPSSGRFPQSGDFHNVFSSPRSHYRSVPAYDEQLSPLTTTFERAHIHTPGTPPAIRHNAAAHAANAAYFDDIPPVPPIHYTTQVPLNDTAPLFPERTSSIAPNRLEQFDFGFESPDDHLPSPTENPWNISYTTNYSSTCIGDDPFANLSSPVFPSIETEDPMIMYGGLGITYSDNTHAPMPNSMAQAQTTYIDRPSRHNVLPSTPHRPDHHHQPSHSDTTSLAAVPATEPRSRPRHQDTSRARSQSRRSTSRHHRRTKSAGNPAGTAPATPRSRGRTAAPDPFTGEAGAGFVNYTPQDSSTILNGVAPSGSSKTKARREKEAADRRRRLSLAAFKAVVEPGGNVESLHEVGLLV